MCRAQAVMTELGWGCGINPDFQDQGNRRGKDFYPAYLYVRAWQKVFFSFFPELILWRPEFNFYANL